jgi:hypothetical protein
MTTEPLAIPAPLAMETAPPVAVSLIPAEIDKSPVRVTAWPTWSEIDPELPSADEPEIIWMSPDVPVDASPVCRMTEPEAAPFPVLPINSPEEANSPFPLESDTAPPFFKLSLLAPARIDTLPPSVFPLPAESNIFPPFCDPE